MRVLWPNFKRTIDGIPGLVMVAVQDYSTGDLLMVAFSDEAGWKQSLATGRVSLYSTSRKKSWVKGEESGNFMQIKTIHIDCDGDTLLYFVEPQGDKVACHTGAYTCFYRSPISTSYRAPSPKAGPAEDLESKEVNEIVPELVSKHPH